MTRILILFFLFLLLGCDVSKRPLNDIDTKNLSASSSSFRENNKFLNRSILNKKLITEIDKKRPQYDFLSYSSLVKINNNQSTNQFNLGIKIQNKKKLLLTGSFIIPLFKVFFTQEQVMFYEKINRSYFKRDYKDLPILLNSQFNLNYFQNIIVGNPIIDLDELRWKQFFDNKIIKVQADSKRNQLKIEYEFDFETLKLKRQIVYKEDQTLEINYKDFEILRNIELPNEIEIIYTNNKKITLIDLKLKISRLDSEFEFTFKIPNGYKEIVL